MRRAFGSYGLLALAIVIVLFLALSYSNSPSSINPLASRLAVPSAEAQGAGRPPNPATGVGQVGISGDVVYEYRAARAGRLFGETGSTTTSTTLVPMPQPLTSVGLRPQTPVIVDVKMCVEIAITSKAPAGFKARIDGLDMFPNVPGTSFVAGYVVQPPVAPVGAFAGLDEHCFNWERFVGPGGHVLTFHWASGSSTARLWGDFFAIKVWAAKLKGP